MAKRKQVISDYEPPAHTEALTGVTFPATWSESARTMAFRRNMTQADVDDIEARLERFRRLRDGFKRAQASDAKLNELLPLAA